MATPRKVIAAVSTAGIQDPAVLRAITELNRRLGDIQTVADAVSAVSELAAKLVYPGSDHLGGRKADEYRDNEESFNELPHKLRPPRLAVLTTGFTRTVVGGVPTYTAKAKDIIWNGSTRPGDVNASPEIVYEFLRKFRHCLTGDVVTLAWEPKQGIYHIVDSPAPFVRWVTLDAPLKRDLYVSGVDMNTTQAIGRIYGRMVPTGFQVKSTARVEITWDPLADAAGGAAHDGDGVWIASVSDDCLEAASP